MMENGNGASDTTSENASTNGNGKHSSQNKEKKKKKSSSKTAQSRPKTNQDSVIEGEAYKMHKRFFHKWKKRYLVLTTENLLVFDSYKDACYNKKCELIPLKGIIVKNSPTKMKKKNAFDVFTPTQQYVLAMETPSEKSQWMNLIAQTAINPGRSRTTSQADVEKELLKLASVLKGGLGQTQMHTIPAGDGGGDGGDRPTREERTASFVRTVSAYPTTGKGVGAFNGPLPGLVVRQGGLARAGDPRSLAGGTGGDQTRPAGGVAGTAIDRKTMNLTVGRSPGGVPIRPSMIKELRKQQAGGASSSAKGDQEAAVAAFFTPPTTAELTSGSTDPPRSPGSTMRPRTLFDPSKKRPPPAPPKGRRNTGDTKNIPRPILLQGTAVDWDRLRSQTDPPLPLKEPINEDGGPEPVPYPSSGAHSPKLMRVESVRRAPKHFLPAPVPVPPHKAPGSPGRSQIVSAMHPFPLIQITEEVPVPIKVEEVAVPEPTDVTTTEGTTGEEEGHEEGEVVREEEEGEVVHEEEGGEEAGQSGHDEDVVHENGGEAIITGEGDATAAQPGDEADVSKESLSVDVPHGGNGEAYQEAEEVVDATAPTEAN